MTTARDVAAARRAADTAMAAYREQLRAARTEGVTLAEIHRETGLSRETLRRDSMPDDEREAFYAARRAPREEGAT